MAATFTALRLASELLPLSKTTVTEAGSTPTASRRDSSLGSELAKTLESGSLPAVEMCARGMR